jgi:type II secretory pathway pseudopilin PulG
MRDQHAVLGRRQERGFTLIEAMIAIVILIFGLAAVANLMVVAGSSNTAANHSTAAATVAKQQMELLKSTRYDQLVVGGSIDADVGAAGECGVTPINTPGVYNCDSSKNASGPNPLFDVDYKGVGTMHVRWRIWPPVAMGSLTTSFIQVAAESTAPAMGRRSRVVLTTYRTDNQ